jgi:hypothetical protein
MAELSHQLFLRLNRRWSPDLLSQAPTKRGARASLSLSLPLSHNTNLSPEAAALGPVGAIHVAASPPCPAWPSLCRRCGVSRWLVGVVGLRAELYQRPHAARGALLQFDWLRKTRCAQAFHHCGGRPGRDG